VQENLPLGAISRTTSNDNGPRPGEEDERASGRDDDDVKVFLFTYAGNTHSKQPEVSCWSLSNLQIVTATAAARKI